jgi:hypothetical protein
MPHIGTVLTWTRNPPISIKFGVKRPRSTFAIPKWRCAATNHRPFCRICSESLQRMAGPRAQQAGLFALSIMTLKHRKAVGSDFPHRRIHAGMRQTKITPGELRASRVRSLPVYCSGYRSGHLRKITDQISLIPAEPVNSDGQDSNRPRGSRFELFTKSVRWGNR